VTYSPESGSAVSSISNLGLAPPLSTVSSVSSNTTRASRSARAVYAATERDGTAQANAGVGISSTGGTGGQARGYAAILSIP
jgi:hypothetical protein